MVINRIGPVSCAKIAGTLYACMGLVIGAVFSTVAFAGGFGPATGAPPAMGLLLGTSAIVALPICYGLLGFVSALIGAWLYNVLASTVGGVELDVR